MVLASNITSTFLAHQLQFFSFGLGSMVLRSRSGVYESKRAVCSGGFLRAGRPNLSLNSDPACIAFRSLSTSRYLGFVHRLGTGGAG